MAKIIRKITGLKPGQNYLVTLKAKNTELSALDSPYPAIRFLTPTDNTIPGEIDNDTFFIYANYKSVMFVFEPTTDIDVDRYKYELYADAAGTNLVSSGTATATVFTVDVPNNSQSETDIDSEEEVKYYGRIKTVDTSGNESGWTPSSGLKESSPTQLIESAHIRNLTASKITAGTISAHEIILKQQGVQTSISAPANMAILRSSDYNGSYNNSTGQWSSGTSGWVIAGNGYAEFSSASIRGGIKASSVFIDANNRWKTNATGATISTPEFKVGSNTQYVHWDGNTLTVQGTLKLPSGSEPVDEDGAADAAKGVIIDGFIGGLTINSTQMYYGAGSFANSNTAFYVAKNDSTGQANFSLGNKLTWDSSSNTLSIQGTLKFPDGSTPGTFDNGDAITDGSIGGLTINATKIFFGTGTYNNTNTAFYIDNTGKFSLKDKLSWDGSTLSINGNITSTSGSIGPWSINSSGISNQSGIRAVNLYPAINNQDHDVLYSQWGDFITKVRAFGMHVTAGAGTATYDTSVYVPGDLQTAEYVRVGLGILPLFINDPISIGQFSPTVGIASTEGLTFSALYNFQSDIVNFGIAIGYTNQGTAGYYIMANDDANTRFRITISAPSDRRLKSDIENISFQENNKLYSLLPREYILSDNYPIESMRGKKQVGLIADEVQDILPEIVLMDAIERHIVHSWISDGNSLTEEQMNLYGDGRYEFAEDGVYKSAEYQQIDYSALIPRLLGTIIDLNKRLVDLENL